MKESGLVLKAFLAARLDVPGVCLIAALAAACSSNASGLSLSAPPSPDGAVENPSVADAGPSSIDGSVVVSLHPTAPGSLNAILNVAAASENPGFIQLSGIGLTTGP